jgi:hypothetical protein
MNRLGHTKRKKTAGMVYRGLRVRPDKPGWQTGGDPDDRPF